MTTASPEIGKSVKTGNFLTNYHDSGDGQPVLLVHGSGPGVTAWANWRLVIPVLAPHFRVLAPDMVGFGYTERFSNNNYSMDVWIQQTIDFLDVLGIEKARIVGNSFGGSLAIALTARHPDRVEKLVLMGSTGVIFPLTEGLDLSWGYEPSFAAMRKLMDYFVYNHDLVGDELAELRYQASIRPGYQESFSSMFPAPRENGIKALSTPDELIRGITQETLVIHGRDDQIIPLDTSLQLLHLIPNSQLHVFGKCGHWTMIERTDDFCRLVLDFFKK